MISTKTIAVHADLQHGLSREELEAIIGTSYELSEMSGPIIFKVVTTEENARLLMTKHGWKLDQNQCPRYCEKHKHFCPYKHTQVITYHGCPECGNVRP